MSMILYLDILKYIHCIVVELAEIRELFEAFSELVPP